MFARANSIFGEPDRVEDGLAYLEGSDRAAVEATPGNRGLTTLVDRSAGVIVALSYWDDLAQSSEASLTRAREGAVLAARGDLVVESFEVQAHEGTLAGVPDAAVRLTRFWIEAAKVAAGLALLRDQLLSRLRSGHGFCGAEILHDQGSGSGVLLTMWPGESDAEGVGAVVGEFREQAYRLGMTFPRTESYALVGTSAYVA
ncbi:hypothetical protein [Pseudonocardia sp. TRM90224]|uniref:hypothetical protein n=1 Tax=Pseudonocardia sp. TRM90224 TaxID=2812678 RepID=UPI001E2DF6B9|nr:hypothetical protein [Pseudonocardia sp. TRM90224]